MSRNMQVLPNRSTTASKYKFGDRGYDNVYQMDFIQKIRIQHFAKDIKHITNIQNAAHVHPCKHLCRSYDC